MEEYTFPVWPPGIAEKLTDEEIIRIQTTDAATQRKLYEEYIRKYAPVAQ